MTDETQDYALQRQHIVALESKVTRLQSLLVELYCGGIPAIRAARREIQRLGVELPRAGVNLTCAERARVKGRKLRAWRREELARLAAQEAPLDITPEERDLFKDDMAEVLAKAMVRWAARKAKEVVEAQGKEQDRLVQDMKERLAHAKRVAPGEADRD